MDIAAKYKDFFRSKEEYVSYLMMKYLEKTEKPAGAWIFHEILQEEGIECSTATIGRYLKVLDRKEYTIQSGNQGRVLTPLGKAFLVEIDMNLDRYRMQKNVSKSVQIKDYSELLDLMHTRLILEKETCRLAALRADEEDFKRLKRVVDEHKACVENNEDPTDPALNFHAVLSKISHNKFMHALLMMLIFEEKKIESMFETLVTRERGSVYVKEHEAIAQAIYERDGEKAAQIMEKHLDIICDAIEEDKQINAEVSVAWIKNG